MANLAKPKSSEKKRDDAWISKPPESAAERTRRLQKKKSASDWRKQSSPIIPETQGIRDARFMLSRAISMYGRALQNFGVSEFQEDQALQEVLEAVTDLELAIYIPVCAEIQSLLQVNLVLVEENRLARKRAIRNNPPFIVVDTT